MRVIICGAGQVGYGIAERLSKEGNDVSIIDASYTLIQSISEQLDVRGITGYASHPDVLARAGASEAEMIIAVTLHDEVNMVACQVAHSLFNIPTKIARVRAQSYLKSSYSDLFSSEHMPIDVIISPELEVGEAVLRRLSLPGAADTISLANGDVVVAGIDCKENCPVIDTPLVQLSELFPDLQAVVVGILRDGKMFVPHSSDQMLQGDLAYVAVERNQVGRTLGIFGHDEKEAKRVIIAGGGNIGLYVARQLESRSNKVRARIIENSRERAIEIADHLRKTVVLHGSALDQQLLKEADIADTDTFVALTNNDNANILSSVMARRLGCRRNLCLINETGYETFSKTLDIDAVLNPRGITVSRILRHVRRGRIRAVHSVQNGMAEVIEAEALETSELIKKPLRELKLPDGVRFGAIYRNGEVILPRGDTQIEAQDRVIIFARIDRVKAVEQMFRVSLEYF